MIGMTIPDQHRVDMKEAGTEASGRFRVLLGIAVALGTFAALGTVSALWENPLFIRMTPTGGFELVFLALQSILLGVFFAIPVTACRVRYAGAGGIVTFLGIACPICNKVLVLVFGAELLMTYLEPARVYLAAFGAVVTGIAVVVRWRLRSTPPAAAWVPLEDSP